MPEIKFASEHLSGRWQETDETATPGLSREATDRWEARNYHTTRPYKDFDRFQIIKSCPCLVVDKGRTIMFRLSRLAFARYCDAMGTPRMSVRKAVALGASGIEYIEKTLTEAMATSTKPVTIMVRSTDSPDTYIVREILREGDPPVFTSKQLLDHLTEQGLTHRIRQTRMSDYGSSYLLATDHKELYVEAGTSLAMKTLYVQGVLHLPQCSHRKSPGLWMRPRARRAFVDLGALQPSVDAILPELTAAQDEASKNFDAYTPLNAVACARRAMIQRRVRVPHRETALSLITQACFEQADNWPTDDTCIVRTIPPLLMCAVSRTIEDAECANRIERANYDLMACDAVATERDLESAEYHIQTVGGDPASYTPSEPPPPFGLAGAPNGSEGSSASATSASADTPVGTEEVGETRKSPMGASTT